MLSLLLGVVSIFAKVLPTAFLQYMQAKSNVQIAGIKAEVARRQLQQEVLLKETEHWIAWLPRFVMGMSIAVYLASVIFVSIFHELHWVVKALPKDFVQIMYVIVGGYFLENITRIVKR